MQTGVCSSLVPGRAMCLRGQGQCRTPGEQKRVSRTAGCPKKFRGTGCTCFVADAQHARGKVQRLAHRQLRYVVVHL